MCSFFNKLSKKGLQIWSLSIVSSTHRPEDPGKINSNKQRNYQGDTSILQHLTAHWMIVQGFYRGLVCRKQTPSAILLFETKIFYCLSVAVVRYLAWYPIAIVFKAPNANRLWHLTLHMLVYANGLFPMVSSIVDIISTEILRFFTHWQP